MTSHAPVLRDQMFGPVLTADLFSAESRVIFFRSLSCQLKSFSAALMFKLMCLWTMKILLIPKHKG